jgi:hypothetical protein
MTSVIVLTIITKVHKWKEGHVSFLFPNFHTIYTEALLNILILLFYIYFIWYLHIRILWQIHSWSKLPLHSHHPGAETLPNFQIRTLAPKRACTTHMPIWQIKGLFGWWPGPPRQYRGAPKYWRSNCSPRFRLCMGVECESDQNFGVVEKKGLQSKHRPIPLVNAQILVGLLLATIQTGSKHFSVTNALRYTFPQPTQAGADRTYKH